MILPNADPFAYESEAYFTEIAKSTKGKTVDKFFGGS